MNRLLFAAPPIDEIFFNQSTVCRTARGRARVILLHAFTFDIFCILQSVIQFFIESSFRSVHRRANSRWLAGVTIYHRGKSNNINNQPCQFMDKQQRKKRVSESQNETSHVKFMTACDLIRPDQDGIRYGFVMQNFNLTTLALFRDGLK